MLPRELIAAALVVAAAAANSPGATAAPSPLVVGLDANGPLASPNAAVSSPWLARADRSGAQVVRVIASWAGVAPAVRPPGFRAADPASLGYSWSSLDARVRSLSSRGFNVLLLVSGAPAWAEGPGRPAAARAGSWRPSAAQFGLFARAAALRYSGRYADPAAAGMMLPRIRYWEAWNEPNLPGYLAPQWVRRGSGYVAASPAIYRRMLNAFYAAVKQVARSNVVIAGGTAPFGDPSPGGSRIPPVLFWRLLLCLNSAGLQPFRCDRAHFDVLDHHPYDLGSPLLKAAQPGDVSIADIGKLTRLLGAARRDRTVLPLGTKAVWTTEIAWSSSPPDPAGVPLTREARWVEQAMYVLWSERVSAVFWLQIRDDTASITPAAFEAGLYFYDGRPKPAEVAYRFPFVTTRERGARILAWGRAPTGGRLRIEVRRGRRWAVLIRLDVRASQVFTRSIPLAGPTTLRAQINGLTSLTWDQS